ncbi:MAG TPA: DUF1707 domain-containing protein [Gaiellaceae bacterium]|nr:DUF1707 domain-containing protein [Gaiellaceae bacterium]
MSSPELRASDADRDRTIAELREHAAVGRLTLEEFSERADRAVAAKTLWELEEIRRDLPRAVPATRASRRPKWFTGILFGRTRRTGRWRLSRRGTAFVVFGDLDLDLRQAELSGEIASITAFLLFGNVDFYVPETVEVDFGGLAVVGHRREWGRDLPPGSATPLLRVRVLSLFGTADLWRVPPSWAGRSFHEVIDGLRRGEERELAPTAGE